MAAKVDPSSLIRGLTRLQKATTLQALTPRIELIAQKLIAFAVDSPVPTDQGTLSASGTTAVVKPGVVRYGFNMDYAAFQDFENYAPRGEGHRVTASGVEVKPVRAKILYIPISHRGKEHAPGANPEEEGLIPEVDYVLRPSAFIPAKRYGSDLGPNRFFSGTLRRRSDWATREIARQVRNAIAESGGGESP